MDAATTGAPGVGHALPGVLAALPAPRRLAVPVVAALGVVAALASWASGAPWPAVMLVPVAAAAAAVPLGRLVAVLLPVTALAGVAASLVTGGSGEAAPWLLGATAGAGALGWWAGRRHALLGARLEQASRRHDAVSVHDDLTGCANHAGLLLFGDHLLHGVRRRGEAMHALVVDVDGLGRVNERLGRPAGDEVLVAVADALKAGTRGTDVVARGPQDEFAVLGPGAGVSPGELERRVRAHLVESPPAPLDVWPCRVTAGLAVLEPWDGGDVTDLLRKAREDLSLRSSLRAPSAPEPARRPENDPRRAP